MENIPDAPKSTEIEKTRLSENQVDVEIPTTEIEEIEESQKESPVSPQSPPSPGSPENTGSGTDSAVSVPKELYAQLISTAKQLNEIQEKLKEKERTEEVFFYISSPMQYRLC